MCHTNGLRRDSFSYLAFLTLAQVLDSQPQKVSLNRPLWHEKTIRYTVSRTFRCGTLLTPRRSVKLTLWLSFLRFLIRALALSQNARLMCDLTDDAQPYPVDPWAEDKTDPYLGGGQWIC